MRQVSCPHLFIVNVPKTVKDRTKVFPTPDGCVQRNGHEEKGFLDFEAALRGWNRTAEKKNEAARKNMLDFLPDRRGAMRC
jgi:hypothetical protein